MELKKASNIEWNDLSRMESPFFAVSEVERSFYSGFGISGIDDVLDNFGRAHTKDEHTLKKLIKEIENGSVFLIMSSPFSPVFRWEKDKWVYNKKIGSKADFHLNTLSKMAKPTGINFGNIEDAKKVKLQPMIIARNKEEKEEKGQEPVQCPLCGKPGKECKREKPKKKGQNVGSGTTLSNNIFVKQSKEDHEWYTGPNSLQAHHLICSEAMDDPKWKIYCNETGYDINRKQNGVMLPYAMDLACQLHAPPHRSSHRSGHAFDLDLKYPDAVMKKLKTVQKNIEKGKYCNKKPGVLENKIDNISIEILNKVNSFTWTLTSDGRDYDESGCGCAGLDSIENKISKSCPVERDHKIKRFNSEDIIPKKSKPLKIGA